MHAPQVVRNIQKERFMRRVALAMLVCLVGAVSAMAAPKVVYVRCGKLIYDAEKPAMSPAVVVITDGKVTSVGKDTPVPAGAEQVDLSSYTVLPGFVDAHIHIWSGPFGQAVSNPLAAVRGGRAMSYALSSGVVGARVLGTEGFIDVALKEAIEDGTIPGPHLVPGAHAITIPGGHGDFHPAPPYLTMDEFYTPMNGFINSTADAEKAVHLQIKYGARVIKVLASGGVLSPLDSPTAEQVSGEELRMIVQQAHMDHIKVAAHAENIRSIRSAIEAGVDSIEHGSELDQAAADFMKSHGIVDVPTVFVVEESVENGAKMHFPEYVITKVNALAKTHFPSFQLAQRTGVTIAAGSDHSYAPGTGTVRDEMIAEVKYGMTPQQALVSGTKTSATLLGLDQLGTIETGKEGDLVAVEGDPLSDIHALEKVRAVVFQGRSVTPANRQQQ
ncbi:MAG TPA: amidohydrolase family protein [Candidatus Methylomirabilis sp.]|nr:amidohydrolase family protein [Candidatus Methylomirabilis sp.]